MSRSESERLQKKAGREWPAAIDFFLSAVKNRQLVSEMVLRDLKSAHASHSFGAFWLFLHPILLVGTFMLIFGVVIGSRLAMGSTFPGDYTAYILAGLMPWFMTSSALGRAPNVLISNSNLVKQVIFNVEILPVAQTLAVFVTFAPAMLLLLAYLVFISQSLSALALLLPLVLLLHALLCLGIMLLLSVTTPFIKDIREVVAVFISISMYATPAMYLPDWVPAVIRPILYLNPFSYMVWVYQDMLFFGEFRHGFAWIVFSVMSLISFLLGLYVFRRLKPYLGNVL